ncbi:MAG: cyclic nucleotide-binding domain-containing protein [Spirochaetota bacterium]
MASIINLKAGKSIFKEGDLGRSMYIVLEGSVEIYVIVNAQEVKLAMMQQGDFFGEMALFRQKPRSACARVVSDVRLAVIDSKPQLEKFLMDNPMFAAKMVTIMASRLANTNDLLVQKMNELSVKKMEYQ